MTPMKNAQFSHFPSPFFCMSEWVRIGRRNLGYHPHPIWYSCSISIIFRRYHHQTPVWNTFWTLIALILIIALDIELLRIPSPFPLLYSSTSVWILTIFYLTPPPPPLPPLFIPSTGCDKYIATKYVKVKFSLHHISIASSNPGKKWTL